MPQNGAGPIPASSITRTPSSVRRGAPLAGQHTREILGELGWSTERIDGLLAAKVIGEETL